MRDFELHKLTLNREKQYRNYISSFKKKAVELSYARGNTKQVCEELDIPYSVLHRGEKNHKIMVRIVFQVEESQN